MRANSIIQIVGCHAEGEVGDVIASARLTILRQHGDIEKGDALVTMARNYLSAQSGEAAGTADHYLVDVHVEHSALSEGRGRAGLPRETLRASKYRWSASGSANGAE